MNAPVIRVDKFHTWRIIFHIPRDYVTNTRPVGRVPPYTFPRALEKIYWCGFVGFRQAFVKFSLYWACYIQF